MIRNPGLRIRDWRCNALGQSRCIRCGARVAVARHQYLRIPADELVLHCLLLFIGEDGYWKRYNPQTGEGRDAMINGKRFKAHESAITDKEKKFDSEVRFNMYMKTHGTYLDGTAKTGKALQDAEAGARRFANRKDPYTQGEATREAFKEAIPVLAQDAMYVNGTDEGLSISGLIVRLILSA